MTSPTPGQTYTLNLHQGSPMAAPQAVVQGNHTPLCCCPDEDDQDALLLFAASPSNNVFLYHIDGQGLPQGQPQHLGQLPGTPTGAVCSHGTLTVMTQQGPYTCQCITGCWQQLCPQPQFPPVAIVPLAGGYYTEALPADTVAELYATHSAPTPQQTSGLQGEARTAYQALVARAAQHGEFIAPVLCRARVVDAAGITVHAYPPVLLTPPAQQPQPTSLHFPIAEGGKVTGAVMTVRGYGVQVHVAGALPEGELPWRYTLHIDLSRQFHTPDLDARPELNIVASRPGTEAAATLTLASRASALLNPGAVNRALEHFDALVQQACTLTCALGAPGMYNITIPAPGSYTTDTAAIDAALRRAPGAPSLQAAQPFTASMGAASASSVLWAGACSRAIQPFAPQCFATRLEDTPWRAWAQVILQGGQTAVLWQGQGTSQAPVEFGPLISYPLPGAVALNFCVQLDGGQRLGAHIPLQTSANISWAATTALEPWPTGTPDNAEPDPYPLPVPQGGPATLAIAPLSAPYAPTALITLPHAVCAITEAPGAGSAWDFGRRRFYAFTPRGVFVVVASPTLDVLHASLITTAPVKAPGHVAPSPYGVFALTAGRVIRLHGSKAQTMLDNAPGADLLAYNMALDSLMLAQSRGSTPWRLHRFAFDRPEAQPYHCAPLALKNLICQGGEIFATATQPPLDKWPDHCPPQAAWPLSLPAVVCLSRGRSADQTFVVHSQPFAPKPGTTPRRAIQWPIYAEYINGTVTLERSNTTPQITAPVATARLCGLLNAPLQLPLIHLPKPLTPLRLTLQALVSPQTIIPDV